MRIIFLRDKSAFVKEAITSIFVKKSNYSEQAITFESVENARVIGRILQSAQAPSHLL